MYVDTYMCVYVCVVEAGCSGREAGLWVIFQRVWPEFVLPLLCSIIHRGT